jgi:hypothetical protein
MDQPMRSILLLRAALVTAGGQVLVSAGAIAAFVMQRKMLLEIKARAEADFAPPAADS